jgi:hypothetical protein
MTRISTLVTTLATVAALAWMVGVGARPASLYADASISAPAPIAHAPPPHRGAHG